MDVCYVNWFIRLRTRSFVKYNKINIKKTSQIIKLYQKIYRSACEAPMFDHKSEYFSNSLLNTNIFKSLSEGILYNFLLYWSFEYCSAWVVSRVKWIYNHKCPLISNAFYHHLQRLNVCYRLSQNFIVFLLVNVWAIFCCRRNWNYGLSSVKKTLITVSLKESL